MSDIKVRSMYRADLPRVLTIERFCFGTPLDNMRVLEGFILPSENSIPMHVEYPMNTGLVAQVDGNVVGFLLHRMNWPRGIGTILRLAVFPQYRRRLVGSRLWSSMQIAVDHLQMHLEWQGYDIPDVEFETQVTESDLNAQLFLRKKSFRCVRILRARDIDGPEDVYLFRYFGMRRTPSARSRKPWVYQKPTS